MFSFVNSAVSLISILALLLVVLCRMSSHHVILEMVALGEVFVAHRAGKGPLVGVSANVAQQLVIPAGTVGALVTSQGELRRRNIACETDDVKVKRKGK